MIAILEAARAGLLRREHWPRNLVAGVTVGFVALPLAMAFAIASGARPEQGLYTAIVAGVVAALVGGSRVQVTGPTGAFVVVLAGITAEHGVAGLQVATLMAGVMLAAMGLARLGSVIKFIPEPVIVGFTSGIAVVIFVGQWQPFLGLEVAGSGIHLHEKLAGLFEALPSLHWPTAVIGAGSLVVLLVARRLIPQVPASLVALLAGTLALQAWGVDGVATIGTAFGGIPRELPTWQAQSLAFGDVLRLIGPAFTIALLGAIESLLSAVVADGIAGGKRHDSNQELIGQGVANVVAPLFGGFAATGAIARTAVNIRSGANSPLAALVHAATLVVIVLLLAPAAAHVPLCALAAILFHVCWTMSEAHHFAHLTRTAPHADRALLWLTFLLTVFADLVIAVNVGVLLASLLFMQRMAQAVTVEAQSAAEPSAPPPDYGPDVLVYSIDGPFFFGAVEKLEEALARGAARPKWVVLRLGRVPFIDATGIVALDESIDDLLRHGTGVVLGELRPAVAAELERAGLLERVGRDRVVASLADWRPPG